MDDDPRIAELISVSKTLEGLARHTSTHAAGVVVSPKAMTHYLPTCRGSKEETLTQYDMKHTEMTGLIKFDFLGLKTLTVIDKALKHIKLDIGTNLNINTIPMDDAKTYDLLCKGDGLGVFQLESTGMRELLVKLAPEQFSTWQSPPTWPSDRTPASTESTCWKCSSRDSTATSPARSPLRSS